MEKLFLKTNFKGKKLEECLNGRNLPNTLGKYNITKNSGETPLN